MTEWIQERSTLGTTIACFATVLFFLEAIVLLYAYHDVEAGRLLLDAGRTLSGRLEYLAHTKLLDDGFDSIVLLLKALIMLISSLLLAASCFCAYPIMAYAACVLMTAIIAISLLYPLSIPLVGANVVLASILATSSFHLRTPKLSSLRPLTLVPLKNPPPRRGPEPFLYGPSPIPL